MRNNGAAGFSDESARFPFVRAAVEEARPAEMEPDAPGFDLIAWYATGAVRYRDHLAGDWSSRPAREDGAAASRRWCRRPGRRRPHRPRAHR